MTYVQLLIEGRTVNIECKSADEANEIFVPLKDFAKNLDGIRIVKPKKENKEKFEIDWPSYLIPKDSESEENFVYNLGKMEFLGDLADNEMRYGMPSDRGSWEMIIRYSNGIFTSYIPYMKHLHNKEWIRYDKVLL